MGDNMGSPGAHGAKSKHRSHTVAWVRFEMNGGSNPDAVEDEGGVLDTTTVPTYAATGLVTLTLRERWRKVMAFAQTDETTAGAAVRCTTLVEGTAAANTVLCQYEVAHVANAANDKTVNVCLHLFR